MPAPTPTDEVRALALAAVWGLLLLLGTPGFDEIPADGLTEPREVALYLDRMPDWSLPLARGVVGFNREVRRPLVKLFDDLQKPLRINQSWGLYLDGSSKCKRMEIDVDGTLVHRTLDPDHAWLADTLRAPPIRPVVSGAIGKEKGGSNWKGLRRLVVRAARRDFPDAREVVIRAMWGPFPECVQTEHHRFVAMAPDWGER